MMRLGLRTIVFCAAMGGCAGQAPSTVSSSSALGSDRQSACVARELVVEPMPPQETKEMLVTLAGRVDDPCATITIVVHPAGSATYYVLPQTISGKDGRWLTTARLGDAALGADQTYELVAFANPKLEPDSAEHVMNAWPSAQARSDLMRITRKVAAPAKPSTTPTDTPSTTPATAQPSKPKADCALSIVAPEHEGKVGDREDVRVEVRGSCRLSSVWIVIHPTAVSTFWVQRQPSARGNVWKTRADFGRLGMDFGASYEVKAFGNPAVPMHEGEELPYWPEAPIQSELIEVTKARKSR